jgi:protein-S-isoprenylcysteine O-methyltransferase Ste14
MTEATLHSWIVWGLIGVSPLVVLALVFVTAPYGRHGRGGWGPTMGARASWVVMESPTVLVFLAVFVAGAHRAEGVPLVLLALWQFHYVRRTLIFPFLIRPSGKRTATVIVGIALVFNALNAYVNARWISHLGQYDTAWLLDPRFIAGVALFAFGWALNVRSDRILINLREPGETGYKIPMGGGYRWVSAPNYLGEILEWLGWALLTWSTAGLSFAIFTAANLAPRAWSNHQWYRETFPDYPQDRRALIPYVL